MWRVPPPLFPTIASTCRSLSPPRARPQCPTASPPCRYWCCLYTWLLTTDCWFNVTLMPFSCLILSSSSPTSCLNLWPRPTSWWNLPSLWPPRVLYSAKHLSLSMSTCHFCSVSQHPSTVAGFMLQIASAFSAALNVDIRHGSPLKVDVSRLSKQIRYRQQIGIGHEHLLL